jgi:hypothetical protein
MDFTPGQKQLVLYWGPIMQSVTERATTAEIWATVRAAAAAEGAPLTGVGIQDMNFMRGIANSQARSLRELGSALPSQVIESTMIGRDLSSRSLADQELARRWIVRFEHDVTIDGGLQTLWRSSVFEGILPNTKGDILNALEQDAQALAEDYGVTHIGIGSFTIAAV